MCPLDHTKWLQNWALILLPDKNKALKNKRYFNWRDFKYQYQLRQRAAAFEALSGLPS